MINQEHKHKWIQIQEVSLLQHGNQWSISHFLDYCKECGEIRKRLPDGTRNEIVCVWKQERDN